MDDANDLKPVEEKYYKLKYVPEECALLDIAKAIEGVAYAPGLGYGFYEFTKPEYILYNKQVIVMDQVFKLSIKFDDNSIMAFLSFRMRSCTMALVHVV